MKIVIAPDSFKGSLSAVGACQAIAAGIGRVLPEAQITSIPMADGGEGTVEALVASTQGQLRSVTATGPLGEQIEAAYGILGKKQNQSSTAIVETATTSGLPMVPVNKRNPLHTTTFGLGQLICDALEQGCREFIVGLGGSATNDCGTGMAQALGVRFFDSDEKQITQPMTGQLMAHVAHIDTTTLHGAIKDSNFTIACDVDNPLLGPRGATAIYGPQKGAGKSELKQLENNMAHIIELIEKATNTAVRNIPGAGAAGGLGAATMAFLKAKLERGIDIVMKQTAFAKQIQHADLIITGEGRIDGSTAFGKTISGIARAGAKANIPVIALAGSVGPETQKVIDIGVKAVLGIPSSPMTLDQAMTNAKELLADTAEQAIRLITIQQNHL